jgi:hypothetical protein
MNPTIQEIEAELRYRKNGDPKHAPAAGRADRERRPPWSGHPDEPARGIVLGVLLGGLIWSVILALVLG